MEIDIEPSKEICKDKKLVFGYEKVRGLLL
jgi:hypothetical protein